jgi:dihydroxyacetone kinase-like protein
MNFDMAAELAEIEGIRVESVVATDDVASMPKGFEHQRRGVAGMFYLYKLAAAKAESGANFDEVKRVAEKVNDYVRTMGVALSPCILPEVGHSTFDIVEGEMEIGMGIHGYVSGFMYIRIMLENMLLHWKWQVFQYPF